MTELEKIMNEPAADMPIVTEVQIDKLFGYLDHKMTFDGGSFFDRNMNLLYGENGSGKTTLLRLIYSCLSDNSREGLRNYIATVPFRRLHIATSLGATIEIIREEPKSGSYTFDIHAPFGRFVTTVLADENLLVSLATSPKLPELEQAIGNLGLDILFLTDDRELRSTLPALRTGPTRRRPRREEDVPEPLSLVARGETDRNWLDIPFIAAVVLAVFRRQIIEQGNVGQGSANAIYLDLAKRLASAWADSETLPKYDFAQTIDQLNKMEDRAAPLRKVGAFPNLLLEELKTVMLEAPQHRRNELIKVIQLFLESTAARLNALEPLISVINLVVKELNGFLSRKTVTFDLVNGFKVSRPSIGEIPLSILSSGEKHLFLLLCSAYLCRQRRCVFLIDEPELSLNVYWQRTLPKTLQRLTEGAPVQYILSTHSLEILTEFSHRIFPLEA